MNENKAETNTKKKRGGGPKTPEGKKRSAKNAVRHGLTGSAVVLPGECPERFAELLSDCLRDFAPQTNTQRDIVHEIAVCRWRIHRCWGHEMGLYEFTVARNKAKVDAEFQDPD